MTSYLCTDNSFIHAEVKSPNTLTSSLTWSIVMAELKSKFKLEYFAQTLALIIIAIMLNLNQ